MALWRPNELQQRETAAGNQHYSGDIVELLPQALALANEMVSKRSLLGSSFYLPCGHLCVLLSAVCILPTQVTQTARVP